MRSRSSLLASIAVLIVASSGARSSEALAVAAARAVTAPRILYSSDWSGHAQIYAVDPARPSTSGQVTFGSDGFTEPHPSPNGRRVAYLGSSSWLFDPPRRLWVARANGTAARRVADGPASGIAWSPDSKLLAYTISGKWHVVREDGSGDRVVASTPPWVREPGVSPDGVWRAETVPRNSRIVALRITNQQLGQTREVTATSVATWSPDSRRIAFTRESGVHVMDVRNGRVLRLTRRTGFALAWAPDGRSIAFVEGTYGYTESTVFTSATGDLLVVDLRGRVLTVLAAGRRYGGRIVSLAWAQPPSTVRYRVPEPAPLTRITPTDLLAGGSISRLVADGKRVAFVSCEGVFSWTPSTGDITTLRPTEPLSTCRLSDRFWVGYSLALAGDRLAYGELQGCHTINLTLRLEALSPSRASSELARGRGQCGSAYSPGVGLLVGSGELLVYSTWHEACSFPPGCGSTSYITKQQQVQLVGSQGCPCPVLASSPGPLIPADANEGRVVAFGENETLLLDRNGRQKLSIPVSPLGAQLYGSDLVLLLRGELRHYDATSGALVRTRPIADVPAGARCEVRCAPAGQVPRLILEDLARGLVAYVLDGQVHVLRLADGADTVVAGGTLARFMDSGLVYADGSRLHIVPFDRLLLR